ncbi:MAG: DnaJ domain-containing protein [Taibaiella sp.]|nr:DnaJ domain-containing protein [Taibaiella sp.]
MKVYTFTLQLHHLLMDNYFELYQLPISFTPLAAQVKSKYFELSRTYHPDRFANADNTTQLQALTMASQVNKAYKTLTDPDATMAYVLQLNGVMEHDEKYTLPPAFLMEMMDINEAVSECEADRANEAARHLAQQTLDEQLETWATAAAALITQYTATPTEEILKKKKDMYFRKKYLLRIKERMAKFATR